MLSDDGSRDFLGERMSGEDDIVMTEKIVAHQYSFLRQEPLIRAKIGGHRRIIVRRLAIDEIGDDSL